MISKKGYFLLKISWLTEEDGQKFYTFPISKNEGCKAGYVRSSIEMLEIKNRKPFIYAGFRSVSWRPRGDSNTRPTA